MPRNDPEYVKPYFHPNPWHQIPGILRAEEVGSFLFFPGITRAREWDHLKNQPGPALTRDKAQAMAGGNKHLAELMLFQPDDNKLGVGVRTADGPKSIFVQVTHVAGLGNLGALVADLQTHGMPADVTRAIRYVNAYDVWMPDDM